jgi:hypothetical protein
MNRCRKGSSLVVFIIVMVVVIIILSLLMKMLVFLTIAPVIRNIVPFIIGAGVGYFFGKNAD